MFTAALFGNNDERMKENKEAMDFIQGADKILLRTPQEVKIGSKTYKVRQPRRFVRERIDRLNREAYWCEQQSKKPLSLKESHRINRRLHSLHAKTAALYVLGLWSLLKPLYALTWRKFMFSYDDVVAGINTAGHSGDVQINFSSANWDLTKAQLAHSTNLIGEGLEDLQKRMESARKQAEEDAMKKNQESK